jgi:hypothetical protein
VSINKIINSYKIVAHSKFVPKEKFCKSIKQNQENVKEKKDAVNGIPHAFAKIREEEEKSEKESFQPDENLCNQRSRASIFIKNGFEKEKVSQNTQQYNENKVPPRSPILRIG